MANNAGPRSSQGGSRKGLQKNTHPNKYPFWFGGSSSAVASCFTHPLDLVKVRMQTMPKELQGSMLRTAITISRKEGVRALYNGISASLLRQLTYSTARFGVYEDLKTRFAPHDSSVGVAHQPLWQLVAMASFSGAIGGIVGNFADVVNVRMQNDNTLPAAERRNYKHALDGTYRIIRDEGFAALFRGVVPNCARAMLMTASQLASYDEFKRRLMATGMFADGLTTHFTASFLAGFVATTVCNPIDVIKTRIMGSKVKGSVVGVLKEAVQTEGFTWMFRGWVPAFTRLAPQTILTFIALEQHKKIYDNLFRTGPQS